MSETASSSDLRAQLIAGAAARELTVFEDTPVLSTGASNGTLVPVVDWKGDWPAFLDLAKHIGVPLVYVASLAFGREDRIVTAITDAGYPDPRPNPGIVEGAGDGETPPTDPESEADPEIEAARWLLKRLTEQTEEWANRDGEISVVFCDWFRDGVAHQFLWLADWLPRFDAIVDGAAEEAGRVATQNRRVRRAEEAKRLHELSLEMARHPRFAEATSIEKRGYMAEKLFPDADPGEYGTIASRAVLVHWWEIAPGEHATRTQKIRELYDAGEAITSIAAILGTSREKVKAALADSDTD